MSELTDILNQLPELGFELNPPASQKELNALRASFGELDDSILELYRHHNGMPMSHSNWQLFDMRLMSIEEAVKFKHSIDVFYANHDQYLAPILGTVSFFWQDDNSNAMGVYVSGELKGMVFILNHENTELSPCFSGIGAMYRQWFSHAKFNFENKETIHQSVKNPLWAMGNWSDFENTDYPRLTPSSADENELKIALSLIEKAKNTANERTRLNYFLMALNLIPFPHTERLLPFLNNENMFIQERAVSYLSLRKAAGLVEPFGNVVIKGSHNGRLAAISALGRIGTSEAEQKLLELIEKIEPQWRDSIARTLHHHYSYEYKRIDKNHAAYRKSPDDEWTEF